MGFVGPGVGLCVVVCWLSCFPWPFLTQASLSHLLDAVAAAFLFAVAAMFVLNLQLAVMRLESEVEGLRRQLEDVQAEAKLLRRAAVLDAADNNAARCELKKRHQQQLAEQQLQHEQQFAAAVEAERDRLRASVGPVLTGMQREQEKMRREAAVAAEHRAALEAELEGTRQLVFEALQDPASVRSRLGF